MNDHNPNDNETIKLSDGLSNNQGKDNSLDEMSVEKNVDAAEMNIKKGKASFNTGEQKKRKKSSAFLKDLRLILDSGLIGEEIIRKNMFVIVLIVLFSLLYISNRFIGQKELIQIDDLKTELVKSKYKALSRTSELMERTLQSKILDYFKTTNDSTLCPLSVAPYKIYEEEK